METRRSKAHNCCNICDAIQKTAAICLCDTSQMVQFNPKDSGELPYKIRRLMKDSGLKQVDICAKLKEEYGVEITVSALSHQISRGKLGLVRALQILAVCDVKNIKIMGSSKK